MAPWPMEDKDIQDLMMEGRQYDEMEDMYAQKGIITIPREKEMAGALPDPIGRDRDGGERKRQFMGRWMGI